VLRSLCRSRRALAFLFSSSQIDRKQRRIVLKGAHRRAFLGTSQSQTAMAQTTGYHALLTSITMMPLWVGGVEAYLRDMTYRNGSPIAAVKASQQHLAPADAGTGTAPMTSMLRTVFAVLALASISMAAELPNTPSSVVRTNEAMIETTASAAPGIVARNREVRLIDKTFVSLAIVSTGSTFADSYTTLFARQNWLAGKTGVCNVEVESAYLYGTHPTVGRAYAVASVKSVGALAAAYYLRKQHNRFWSLPLVANAVMSLQGVGQNMAACN